MSYKKDDYPIAVNYYNVANSPLLLFFRQPLRWMSGHLVTLKSVLFETCMKFDKVTILTISLPLVNLQES